MKTKRVYTKVESNIRRVDRGPVLADGTVGQPRTLVGFEVRVKGGERAGPLQPSITKARELRGQAVTEVARGAFRPPREGKVTVTEMADRWLGSSRATMWKPRTRAGYEGIVRYRLAPLHDVMVRDVTPQMVDEFLVAMQRDEGLAASTVRHVFHVLNQALRLAVRDGLIASNPCAQVERPSLVRDEPAIPEREDVDKLLQALCDLDHARAGEWALYAEVAAYAGLRAGEITGLRVGSLLPLENALLVIETVTVLSGVKKEVVGAGLSVGTPKSRAGKRRVPLPPSLSARLAAHVAGKDRGDYVFGDGVTPFRHGNFYRRVFRPAAAAVGLPTLTFHQLRHFYASVLLTNPHLSVVDIAKVLGHADANLLFNTYGHSFQDAGRGVGEWLDDLRSSPAMAAGAVVPIKKASG